MLADREVHCDPEAGKLLNNMHFSDILKYILSLILIFLPARFLSGQADSVTVGKPDTVETSVVKQGKHSLYASAALGSNMVYLGSTITSNKPYYSAGLTYGYKTDFYLSASASHIQGTDPFAAFMSLSANYLHTFNKWFDISAQASGFFPAQSLKSTLFNNFVFGNFTAGFDWKILYTKVSAGALLSSTNTGFIQFSNSRYFETHSFFKGKAFVSFDPEINLLFGEIITEKTQTGEKRYTPPFRHYRKIPPPPLVTYSERFGAMNAQFILPVAFNYGKFNLEAMPCYIVPATNKSINYISKGFTFYLTAVFKIF